jgi:hypothetical protein
VVAKSTKIQSRAAQNGRRKRAMRKKKWEDAQNVQYEVWLQEIKEV